MLRHMFRNFQKRIHIIILGFGFIGFFLWTIIGLITETEIYESSDVSDYGNYIGNYDNETPREFINSFFPEHIEEIFTDITYHYKAKKFDTYAYEAYLEFVIDDIDGFQTILNRYVDQSKSKPFLYNESYMDYSISNVLRLHIPEKAPNTYALNSAYIGKILYSQEEQRLIFWALGVFDGGGTDTSELNFFFDRFEIDVMDYQQNAYWTHEDQAKGLLYKERFND